MVPIVALGSKGRENCFEQTSDIIHAIILNQNYHSDKKYCKDILHTCSVSCDVVVHLKQDWINKETGTCIQAGAKIGTQL